MTKKHTTAEKRILRRSRVARKKSYPSKLKEKGREEGLGGGGGVWGAVGGGVGGGGTGPGIDSVSVEKMVTLGNV